MSDRCHACRKDIHDAEEIFGDEFFECPQHDGEECCGDLCRPCLTRLVPEHPAVRLTDLEDRIEALATRLRSGGLKTMRSTALRGRLGKLYTDLALDDIAEVVARELLKLIEGRPGFPGEVDAKK